MVISCCDSRVHVTSIFGAEQGEFFIHRNIAYLIVIIYIYLLFFVIKDTNKKFRKPFIIIGVSLFLQVLLGVIVLLSGVKIIYASLHQINSIIIILSTLYFLYISKYAEKNN